MPQNTADLIPGGGPNQPGGLAQITSGGFYSTSTLGSAVQPAYSFSDDSLGFYQSGASTVALSYGTFNLFTSGARFSVASYANASGMLPGELRVVFQASGISLLWSSGVTQYTIGGSSTSLAQS